MELRSNVEMHRKRIKDRKEEGKSWKKKTQSGKRRKRRAKKK